MFLRVVASLWAVALAAYGLKVFTIEDDGAGGMLLAMLEVITLIAIWAPVA